MPCFADIVLKCNKRIGKLILSDLIARFGKPRGRRAWRIDKRAMRRAADIAFEPFAYFDYYRCGESAPYALLSLNYSAGAAFFDGWGDALRRYNGRRDRTDTDRYYSDEYAEKILRRAEDPDLFVPIEIKLAKTN